ncbi:hypothetical protein BJX64DRAFT_263384 [Aspergillus heterothallicus]
MYCFLIYAMQKYVIYSVHRSQNCELYSNPLAIYIYLRSGTTVARPEANSSKQQPILQKKLTCHTMIQKVSFDPLSTKEPYKSFILADVSRPMIEKHLKAMAGNPPLSRQSLRQDSLDPESLAVAQSRISFLSDFQVAVQPLVQIAAGVYLPRTCHWIPRGDHAPAAGTLRRNAAAKHPHQRSGLETTGRIRGERTLTMIEASSRRYASPREHMPNARLTISKTQSRQTSKTSNDLIHSKFVVVNAKRSAPRGHQ